MNTKALIILLEETVGRLCEDCRNQVPFNMAGSHSFDVHARSCKAVELRAALKELKELQSVPQTVPGAMALKSFDITWGPDHGRPAGYYVSIPNYNGGAVVPLAEVELFLRRNLVLPREGHLRGQPIFSTDTDLAPEKVLPPGSPGSIRSY